MLPTKKQWQTWSLPSKLTAIGTYAGLLALLLTVMFFAWPWITGEASKPEARHSEIMRALKERNKSLKDTLWEKYPFGYVLFGSADGNIVSMPFYNGDLFVEAKWEQTQIEPDYATKTVKVTIAQPQWKQENGSHIHINIGRATSIFPLQTGTPMPFRFVYSAGQPQMLFEVLDNNQRSPIYVIGFRK
jgi:hypothetical protein